MSERKIPYHLEKEEEQALLDVFNTRYPTQERNRTMVLVMLKAGLRLAEVINLKWKNISFQGHYIYVREGKGAKDRKVWVNDKVVEQLSSWKIRQQKELKKRDSENKNNLIFTTLSGNKLNQNNVRSMVYKYAEKAEIQEYEIKENDNDKEYKEWKVSPHTLRHTFATNLYRQSKDIRLVQRALGHENLETTRIYTHIVDDELEQAMRALE